MKEWLLHCSLLVTAPVHNESISMHPLKYAQGKTVATGQGRVIPLRLIKAQRTGKEPQASAPKREEGSCVTGTQQGRAWGRVRATQESWLSWDGESILPRFCLLFRAQVSCGSLSAAFTSLSMKQSRCAVPL